MKVLRNFTLKTNFLIIKNIPFILIFNLLLFFIQPFRTFSQNEVSTGTASYYSNTLQGRTTASGEKYDKNKYTAAHRSYTFGTKLKVTNLKNGKSILVTVNDRGPYSKLRLIDVSYCAAKELDMLKLGITQVNIEEVAENYMLPSCPTKKQSNLEEGFYTPALIPTNKPAGPFLQVGAFALQENALTKIEALRSNNIGTAHIQVITVRRKKIYRVLYSDFDSIESMNQIKKELNKKGIDAIIIDAK